MNIDNLFEYLVCKHHWTEEETYPYDLLSLLYPDKALSPNDKSDLEILADEFDNRRLMIKEDWLEEEMQHEAKDLSELNRKLDDVSGTLFLIILAALTLFVVAFMFLPATEVVKIRVVVAAVIFFLVVLWVYMTAKISHRDKELLRKRIANDSTAIAELEKHVSMMDQCARETRRFIDEHSGKSPQNSHK